MDLRKVRIQLTAIYTVLSALSIGVIALYAVNAGRDRLLRSAERDVVEQHTSVLLALNAGKTDFDEEAWVVDLDDGSSRPLSDNTNVEPPLRTLAQRAGGSADVELQQFTYDDHRYVAATKKLSDNEANKQYLISAVNIAATTTRPIRCVPASGWPRSDSPRCAAVWATCSRSARSSRRAGR